MIVGCGVVSDRGAVVGVVVVVVNGEVGVGRAGALGGVAVGGVLAGWVGVDLGKFVGRTELALIRVGRGVDCGIWTGIFIFTSSSSRLTRCRFAGPSSRNLM